MLVNESSFDFALCVICYLSIALDISYVLIFDFFVFLLNSCFVFFFCLILLLDLACGPCFCFSSHFASLGFHPWLQFLVLAQFLVLTSNFHFRLWLLPGFHFVFLFLTSCFWLLLGSHFSLLSFTFHLWVKTHYGGPKVTDVVFIISLFHSAKLESLFQNRKHSPLKQKICGFQKSLLQKSYILFIF